MKIETWKCDRCGKLASTKEGIEELALGDITLGFKASYSSYSAPSVYAAHQLWSRQWCRSCREKLGIVEAKVCAAHQNNEPVPSLEDIVREIVQEEIINHQ